MNAIPSIPLSMDESVHNFLRAQEAEEAFRLILNLAHSCYPEAQRLDVELRDDPDEVDLQRVVLFAVLSRNHPPELLYRQRQEYHRRLIETIPLRYCPLFRLLVDLSGA
jgi:hypothetical protein